MARSVIQSVTFVSGLPAMQKIYLTAYTKRKAKFPEKKHNIMQLL